MSKYTKYDWKLIEPWIEKYYQEKGATWLINTLQTAYGIKIPSGSIRSRAQRLGLKLSPTTRRRISINNKKDPLASEGPTRSEIADPCIKKFYATLGPGHCAEVTGFTTSYISARAGKLGIRMDEDALLRSKQGSMEKLRKHMIQKEEEEKNRRTGAFIPPEMSTIHHLASCTPWNKNLRRTSNNVYFGK